MQNPQALEPQPGSIAITFLAKGLIAAVGLLGSYNLVPFSMAAVILFSLKTFHYILHTLSSIP